MSVIYDATERLLPPTSSIHVDAEPNDATTEHDEPNTGTDRGRSPSFVDDYEAVGGVPTRVIKPSESESRFTCHAFSKDGSRLATGEKNGTIRLWKTVGYRCLTELSRLFEHPVDCLSFVLDYNDRLIAIDKEGNLREFAVMSKRRDARWASSSSSEVTAGRRLKIDIPGSIPGYVRNSMFQFSEDGRTLACSYWERCIADHREGHSWVCVYRFRGWQDFVDTTIKAEGSAYWVFDLSQNGRSLLARNSDSESVFVYPKIVFRKRQHHCVRFKGGRASWGLKGEFILLWSSVHERPHLTIYRTEKLSRGQNSDSPVAQKTLGHGLSKWSARMLDSTPPDGRTNVLIFEISTCSKRRFYIWDIVADAVTNEVNMTIRPERSIDVTQWDSTALTVQDSVELDQDREVYITPRHMLMEDSCFKFCASGDSTWIGLFSSNLHSCAISSMVSGATVLSFALPEEVLMDPIEMPNQAMFDPFGKHFVVFGDSCIVACAPSILNPESVPRVHTISLEQCEEAEDRKMLCDAFRSLPSEALAQSLCMCWGNQSSPVKFNCGVRSDSMSSSPAFPDIVDAVLSKDGLRLAFITSASPTITNVHVGDISPTGQCSPRDFAHSSFPIYIDSDRETFVPGKLFLYNKGRKKEADLVLFSRGFQPVVVFCDIHGRERTVAKLDIRQCLRFSQTEDRTHMCLLDIQSVCILDLRTQNIVRRIRFEVDFSLTTTLAKKSTRWAHSKYYYNYELYETRIADDGASVLLGWDAKNGRSILVTPSMTQHECEQRIQASEGMLSEYCELSRDGRCTSFIDVAKLPQGRVCVLISNHNGVTRCLEVEHNLGISKLSRTELPSLLSSVFYRVSPDGAELITMTLHPSGDEDHMLLVEPCVRRFSLYCTDDWMPSYEQIIRQSLSRETAVMQLLKDYSASVFNGPPHLGRSIFQEAAMRRDQKMIDSILDVSKKNGIDLALEWVSLDDDFPNLLQAALSTNSTNDVHDAVRLIGSKLSPFRSAARVMQQSFMDLSMLHRDVLENALSDNLLVIEACCLRVHVSFMNAEIRNKTAVHIDTADTILEWSCVSDQECLKNQWKAENSESVASMERKGNMSTSTASLRFVCIEDAAKTGMKGIVRPLLLQNAPEHFFEFDVVKWTVLFKWFRIWRRRFIKSAVIYGAFLLVFSWYASLVARSGDMSTECIGWMIVTGCALLVTVCFGLRLLLEEIAQIKAYTKDGMEHFGRRSLGVRYFFSSRWNWVDLMSCALLLVVIPTLHWLELMGSTYKHWLSAFVAIEAILAFIKVWYFAQPFRESGALVLMINNIVRDCLAFLFLAFVVCCGFSIALHVLFRHKSDNADDLNEAFGTIPSSLLTLFYATLGAFEPELYRSSGDVSWLATLIFNVYLGCQMIVLLNLLIAIMGDTFDKVKSTEEAQVLMGRAAFIDACEAGLTERERDEMESKIGKYVRVVMSPEDDSDDHSANQWMGKLAEIQRSCRKTVSSSEQRLKELIKEQETKMMQSMKDAATGMECTVENVKRKVNESETRLMNSMQCLESRIEGMNQATGKQLERIFCLLSKAEGTEYRSSLDDRGDSPFK